MSNPFDDLQNDDQEDTDESETEETPSNGQGDAQTSPTSEDAVAPEPDPEPTRETPEQPTDETDPADAGPAFEYSEVRQKPLYARGSTWDEFEKNFRTTIAPKLAEADVVDEETRELHDALVQLGNEQPERVAEIMLETRRQS